MDQNLFKDEDLADLFAELENENEMGAKEEEDQEMTASERRYQEIIKKHKEMD